jgi:hypothetical protein
MPVILFEVALIYAGTFVDLFKWIFIGFIIVIIVVNIVYFIRQIMMIHEVHDHEIHVKVSKKKTIVIDLNTVKEVTYNKYSIGLSYYSGKKMKTHYVNRFLKEYKKFLKEFDERIKKTEQYEEINFIK